MRFLVLVFLLTSFINYVKAQDYIDFDYHRDYQNILKESKVDSSSINFTSLFNRFLKGDSTLTNYEMIAMQIGYTDNENYWPYQDIMPEREVWSLNEAGKYKEAIKTCEQILLSNPFNILANREKSYAFKKLNQADSASIYFDRFDKIVTSYLSTGNGTSYENSIFVMSPADGQWIIKLAFQSGICYMGSGRDEQGYFHDILGLKMEEDSDDCINLYFNIAHASKRMFGPEMSEDLESLIEEETTEDKKIKKRKRRKNRKKKNS
ncbi:DUF4919 domain-containing protein [Sediminitomix flava]|uniref:Uncharacterized protein DUF4919 n=1 Tax=Sediminitomix flava TaxID=379075 RepID=A0A315ZHA8_SEDFL|nr:DUF4919 domain-containing protein [Sediminitomix flava]PWJ44573.1 uncharacterized protein DUF4919 [Sediminitomix flava]